MRCWSITILLFLTLAAGASASSAQEAAANEKKQSPPDGSSQASTPAEVSTDWTRLTMGIEQAAASSSPRSTNLLLDFMLTAPVLNRWPSKEEGDPPGRHQPTLAAWANIRLTGVPQQGSTTVKQFVGGFESTLIGGSTREVIQGLNFLGGIEIKLGTDGLSFDDDLYQFQPVFIVGGGFSTTPGTTDFVPVFELTDEARTRFGVPSGPDSKFKHIAFLQPDRDTFYGQWYWGIRLKTHHYEDAESEQRVRFPGLIDVTFGQNAVVSGGTLDGGFFDLLRIEAFYPLPLQGARRSIYLFGAAYLHLRDGRESDPLVLKGSKAELPSPEVFEHTLTREERRRDFWKFGVGIDLIALFAPPKKSSSE